MLGHSKPCEACSILSKRQESNRENKLILSIWNNAQAETGPDGKKKICHSYVHRHDVSETFSPYKSNVKEARAHAKKVIHKARREGCLDILEGQVEKIVKRGGIRSTIWRRNSGAGRNPPV